MDKQKIITRREAIDKGLSKYYTGKPCKYGHYDYRHTSGWNCCTCKAERNSDEKHRENTRKWQEANPDKVRDYKSKWRKNNSEKHRRYNSKWSKDNPGIRRAIEAKRRAAKIERTVPWADEYKIKAIYAQASDEQHHVDHIIPLQGEIVSGLHVHENLQILPADVNVQKGNRITREELDAIAEKDLLNVQRYCYSAAA